MIALFCRIVFFILITQSLPSYAQHCLFAENWETGENKGCFDYDNGESLPVSLCPRDSTTSCVRYQACKCKDGNKELTSKPLIWLNKQEVPPEHQGHFSSCLTRTSLWDQNNYRWDESEIQYVANPGKCSCEITPFSGDRLFGTWSTCAPSDGGVSRLKANNQNACEDTPAYQNLSSYCDFRSKIYGKYTWQNFVQGPLTEEGMIEWEDSCMYHPETYKLICQKPFCENRSVCSSYRFGNFLYPPDQVNDVRWCETELRKLEVVDPLRFEKAFGHAHMRRDLASNSIQCEFSWSLEDQNAPQECVDKAGGYARSAYFVISGKGSHANVHLDTPLTPLVVSGTPSAGSGVPNAPIQVGSVDSDLFYNPSSEVVPNYGDPLRPDRTYVTRYTIPANNFVIPEDTRLLQCTVYVIGKNGKVSFETSTEENYYGTLSSGHCDKAGQACTLKEEKKICSPEPQVMPLYEPKNGAIPEWSFVGSAFSLPIQKSYAYQNDYDYDSIITQKRSAEGEYETSASVGGCECVAKSPWSDWVYAGKEIVSGDVNPKRRSSAGSFDDEGNFSLPSTPQHGIEVWIDTVDVGSDADCSEGSLIDDLVQSKVSLVSAVDVNIQLQPPGHIDFDPGVTFNDLTMLQDEIDQAYGILNHAKSAWLITFNTLGPSLGAVFEKFKNLGEFGTCIHDLVKESVESVDNGGSGLSLVIPAAAIGLNCLQKISTNQNFDITATGAALAQGIPTLFHAGNEALNLLGELMKVMQDLEDVEHKIQEIKSKQLNLGQRYYAPRLYAKVTVIPESPKSISVPIDGKGKNSQMLTRDTRFGSCETPVKVLNGLTGNSSTENSEITANRVTIEGLGNLGSTVVELTARSPTNATKVFDLPTTAKEITMEQGLELVANMQHRLNALILEYMSLLGQFTEAYQVASSTINSIGLMGHSLNTIIQGLKAKNLNLSTINGIVQFQKTKMVPLMTKIGVSNNFLKNKIGAATKALIFAGGILGASSTWSYVDYANKIFNQYPSSTVNCAAPNWTNVVMELALKPGGELLIKTVKAGQKGLGMTLKMGTLSGAVPLSGGMFK